VNAAAVDGCGQWRAPDCVNATVNWGCIDKNKNEKNYQKLKFEVRVP